MRRTSRKWTPGDRDRTGRRLNTLVGATVVLTVVGSAGLTGAIALEKSTVDQSVVAEKPPAGRKEPGRAGRSASSAPNPIPTPLLTPPPEGNAPYGLYRQPGPAHARSGGS